MELLENCCAVILGCSMNLSLCGGTMKPVLKGSASSSVLTGSLSDSGERGTHWVWSTHRCSHVEQRGMECCQSQRATNKKVKVPVCSCKDSQSQASCYSESRQSHGCYVDLWGSSYQQHSGAQYPHGPPSKRKQTNNSNNPFMCAFQSIPFSSDVKEQLGGPTLVMMFILPLFLCWRWENGCPCKHPPRPTSV